MDLLLNHNTETGDKLLKCETYSLTKLEAEVRELLLNNAQMIRNYDDCSHKYSTCTESLVKYMGTEAHERNQYSNCSKELTKCETTCSRGS